jgi:hypothetical protein
MSPQGMSSPKRLYAKALDEAEDQSTIALPGLSAVLIIEPFQADWNRGDDPVRHGPACPGHLSRHSAGIGGPDKLGHDGVVAPAAFPVSLNTL